MTTITWALVFVGWAVVSSAILILKKLDRLIEVSARPKSVRGEDEELAELRQISVHLFNASLDRQNNRQD